MFILDDANIPMNIAIIITISSVLLGSIVLFTFIKVSIYIIYNKSEKDLAITLHKKHEEAIELQENTVAIDYSRLHEGSTILVSKKEFKFRKLFHKVIVKYNSNWIFTDEENGYIFLKNLHHTDVCINIPMNEVNKKFKLNTSLKQKD